MKGREEKGGEKKKRKDRKNVHIRVILVCCFDPAHARCLVNHNLARKKKKEKRKKKKKEKKIYQTLSYYPIFIYLFSCGF
jgi:hypothetical protein